MSAIPSASVRAAWARAIGSLTVALAAAPGAFSLQCPIGFVGGDLAGESLVGGLSPSVSADGRLVAYLRNVGLYHAFVYDRWSGARTLLGGASVVALSANGKRAALLGSGAAFGGFGLQICIQDLEDGSRELVTIELDGTPMTQTGT